MYNISVYSINEQKSFIWNRVATSLAFLAELEKKTPIWAPPDTPKKVQLKIMHNPRKKKRPKTSSTRRSECTNVLYYLDEMLWVSLISLFLFYPFLNRHLVHLFFDVIIRKVHGLF